MNDLADAYQVQNNYVAAIIGTDHGAGYKIGLTSKRMQQMCGIDQPIRGTIFSRRVIGSGAHVSLSDYQHLGLEFEICVRLGSDLIADGTPFTPESAGDAVDAVAAAIELVDDRHADYSVLDCETLVADNSWNAGIVVGAFTRPAHLDTVEGIAWTASRFRVGWRRCAWSSFRATGRLANHLAASGEARGRGCRHDG
jgi:2-oxo-3-hexenedioate decarboxylase/2-keto-4-pentenoate hydratase